jgi:hypothetical protein
MLAVLINPHETLFIELSLFPADWTNGARRSRDGPLSVNMARIDRPEEQKGFPELFHRTSF